jgi:hypothetical protein
MTVARAIRIRATQVQRRETLSSPCACCSGVSGSRGPGWLHATASRVEWPADTVAVFFKKKSLLPIVLKSLEPPAYRPTLMKGNLAFDT